MLSHVLRQRLLLVMGFGSLGLPGCGQDGHDSTGQVTTSGAGAGGMASAGQDGGGEAGASAGSGGASAGAGGVTTAGSGGASGTGGSDGVPCPPVEAGPTVTCWSGGPLSGPAGCSTDPMSGGMMGCYQPGAAGAPASPCVSADDPSLPMYLGQGCTAFSMVEGPAACRSVQRGSSGPVAAECCYAAQVEVLCTARPFRLGGTLRSARLVARVDWAGA